ncbi:MAG: amino acid permease [Chitinivibrionales bacterium]|nr:amino acid permease [Chitinivibrionales bacterium]MBD3396305.1 amino acid permease [Chitinivibrionales bacterium]
MPPPGAKPLPPGAPESGPAKFGAFGGVFTPSILTIFGVIMFMRAGYVVGQAGIAAALMILVLSKSITLFTGFSISAIATNTEVKSGGAYFLISRTLGPEFGGAIGLALYTAQALSVPFYVLGFTEALVKSLHPWFPFLTAEFLARPLPYAGTYFAAINFVVLFGLFVVTFVGAHWAIKTQYLIMAVLVLAILAFLGGLGLRFDPAMLRANMGSGYTDGSNFWIIFAIYFPAATGIMAGVNMSGNLKNPTRAIPLGTIMAVLLGALVYGAQIVLMGGAVSREQLIARPYTTLMEVARFHTPFMPLGLGLLVAAGVICATLSSGLGSFLGAPRILQALAQDKLLTPFSPFAKLSRSGEPRRALILTFVLSAGVLYYARNGGSGGALNAIASIITMLFLCTYGITNLAAFVESFGRNPSFRPRFRLFHWSIALLGAIGCAFAAFLIDAAYAFAAVVVVALLFFYVRKFVLKTSFGDARRGFYYSRIRENLFKLQQLPVHPKNWRPTILVLSGNPNTRLALVKYASWLGSGRGMVTIASVLVGDFHARNTDRIQALKNLQEFINGNKLLAFPQVLVTPDFDTGLSHLLQTAGAGPLRPNLILWGWSDDPNRSLQTVKNLRTAHALQMSQIIVRSAGIPSPKQRKRRIDIWWRGKHNGSLLVILAYLISLNPEWTGCRIRVLRVVKDEHALIPAHAELDALMEIARIPNAKIEIVVSADPFPDILRRTSDQATVILLGFGIPEDNDAPLFQKWFSSMLKDMPTTLLVHSTGEADVTS